MRLLSERADHDGQGAARPQPESDRCGDPGGNGWHAVPLHDTTAFQAAIKRAAASMGAAGASDKGGVA